VRFVCAGPISESRVLAKFAESRDKSGEG